MSCGTHFKFEVKFKEMSSDYLKVVLLKQGAQVRDDNAELEIRFFFNSGLFF